MCLQEDPGQEVERTAWTYTLDTVRNADTLKRYQGLKAAMRMLATQVLGTLQLLQAGYPGQHMAAPCLCCSVLLLGTIAHGAKQCWEGPAVHSPVAVRLVA